MSRFPLAIENYMSHVLVVIGPKQPLAEAIRLMRLHEVRHLPVVTNGKLDGLISQRDIYLMQSLERSDPSRILVSEAMTSDVYTVEPEEPVDRVAREMVRRRIGTALVTHGPRLMGIFTATDALLALAALVEDDRVPGEEAVAEAIEAEKAPGRKAGRTGTKRRAGARGAKLGK